MEARESAVKPQTRSPTECQEEVQRQIAEAMATPLGSHPTSVRGETRSNYPIQQDPTDSRAGQRVAAGRRDIGRSDAVTRHQLTSFPALARGDSAGSARNENAESRSAGGESGGDGDRGDNGSEGKRSENSKEMGFCAKICACLRRGKKGM